MRSCGGARVARGACDVQSVRKATPINCRKVCFCGDKGRLFLSDTRPSRSSHQTRADPTCGETNTSSSAELGGCLCGGVQGYFGAGASGYATLRVHRLRGRVNVARKTSYRSVFFLFLFPTCGGQQTPAVTSGTSRWFPSPASVSGASGAHGSVVHETITPTYRIGHAAIAAGLRNHLIDDRRSATGILPS